MTIMRPGVHLALAFAALTILALVPTGSADSHADYESESLRTGESFSFVFDDVGYSPYHCHPHPTMEGKLTIEASDGSAPKTHIVKIVEPTDKQSSWAFEPAELTIMAGDTVKWVNEGKVEHVVMGWISADPDAAADHDHDHGDAHTHGDHAEAPALVPLLPLLAALGVVVLMRRR